MNKFVKYLLINLCIAGIIGFLTTKPTPSYRFEGRTTHVELGTVLMLLSLPMLLLGLILTLVAKDKVYGTSLLSAGGILILIGFGVCTITNPPPY